MWNTPTVFQSVGLYKQNLNVSVCVCVYVRPKQEKEDLTIHISKGKRGSGRSLHARLYESSLLWLPLFYTSPCYSVWSSDQQHSQQAPPQAYKIRVYLLRRPPHLYAKNKQINNQASELIKIKTFTVKSITSIKRWFGPLPPHQHSVIYGLGGALKRFVLPIHFMPSQQNCNFPLRRACVDPQNLHWMLKALLLSVLHVCVCVHA